MRHRLLPLPALALLLLAAFLAPSARSSAQADVNRPPDRAVLRPLQPQLGPGITSTGDYVSPPTAAAHPFPAGTSKPVKSR